jgi:tRNA/rRNA methyltransferase
MSSSPIIILVHPQLVENIGMSARAMMNCGLTEMRIVNPRDPWPLGDIHQQRMTNAASGADDVLGAAKIFDTVEAAIADLNYVYATTARPHDMVNRIFTARAATPDMAMRIGQGQRVGVMFGPERTGLTGDHVALASARITVPLNPAFSSLNLAQAVLLIGYEWRQAQDQTPPDQLRIGSSRPATREEYLNFFRRFESVLEESGFFVAEDMRPSMVRSLQSMLQRAEMTEQEVRTWHGVITALADGPRRRRPEGNS